MENKWLGKVVKEVQGRAEKKNYFLIFEDNNWLLIVYFNIASNKNFMVLPHTKK